MNLQLVWRKVKFQNFCPPTFFGLKLFFTCAFLRSIFWFFYYIAFQFWALQLIFALTFYEIQFCAPLFHSLFSALHSFLCFNFTLHFLHPFLYAHTSKRSSSFALQPVIKSIHQKDVHYFFNIFRDLKLKQSTVNRLDEIEQEVKLESKQRLENEKEMRTSLETVNNKVKLYTDECTEASRQMLSAEIETLRSRIGKVQ